MRLWSLHPKYLDQKGLVALWRETLLAKAVLEGKTKGYKNHSQLIRFKALKDPVKYINLYLYHIWQESHSRGYNFDITKFSQDVFQAQYEPLQVTQGQLDYEFKHLLNKLQVRDPNRFETLKDLKTIETDLLFEVVEGPIAYWEKIIL